MSERITKATTIFDPSEPPEWFIRDLVEPFKAGVATVFIVHGNINCLLQDPDAEGPSYIPLRKFFETVFADRMLLISYNIATGAWTPSPEMERIFRKAAGIEEEKIVSSDPIAAAKASLAAKRGIPREPEACLPLIDKALRTIPGTAVIIETAHALAPASGTGIGVPVTDRVNIERLCIWGRSQTIRKNGGIVLLFTDQVAKISQELRLANSEIRKVFIPKPSKAERKAYIALATASAKKDLDALANATQGMGLRQISDLFSVAKTSGKALDLDLVRVTKARLLNDEYGDVMDVIEPTRGLENIGGLDHIKEYFRDVLESIRAGESRLVPMGVTLMGPPGTGKTAMVEALAKEAGFSFVKSGNIRSMWVGESEVRMEKFLNGLLSLAPVVVMNDEADLAEAGRDASKGDSGVSERIMKMWMEFLSDPRIRGQVIVISCTNRPDRTDPAVKRSGRNDVRLLMPMPSEKERPAIFGVMFKRHKIPNDLSDFTAFNDATDGLSGADLEKIVLDAYRVARKARKESVGEKELLASLKDFIPSASQKDIDFMTLVGLLECSSHKLLPANVEQLVAKIRDRNLVKDLDKIFEQLVARGIVAGDANSTPAEPTPPSGGADVN